MIVGVPHRGQDGRVRVAHPTYEVDRITHYCVTNMPGAVPVTSTFSLANATMPYVLRLADRGLAALQDDPGFMAGLNVHAGEVMYAPVGDAIGVDVALLAA